MLNHVAYESVPCPDAKHNVLVDVQLQRPSRDQLSTWQSLLTGVEWCTCLQHTITSHILHVCCPQPRAAYAACGAVPLSCSLPDTNTQRCTVCMQTSLLASQSPLALNAHAAALLLLLFLGLQPAMSIAFVLPRAVPTSGSRSCQHCCARSRFFLLHAHAMIAT